MVRAILTNRVYAGQARYNYRQPVLSEYLKTEEHQLQYLKTRHQSVQWQQVMDNTETFCQLLGENLAQLSFEERQTIAQCLISKVIVTGEAVDI